MMPVRLAIAILCSSVSIWIALFDFEFSLGSIISPLLFSSTSLIGPYWLFLKYKKSADAGPGILTLVIWFIITLGSILAWRNDLGDWSLENFVIIHSAFATPAIVLAYALWRLMRWLRSKLPFAASALRFVLLLVPILVVAAIAVGHYADMKARKASSTRASVIHDAALRFGDTVLFGTTSGILGWRVSESSTLDRILEEVPDASMFADMERGRLLLIKSSAGVFCTGWGVRKVSQLKSLPSVKSLFRAGRFAWAISAGDELFQLQSPSEECGDLIITKVEFSGRKLAAAEISGSSVLFVACKHDPLGERHEDCSIHRWATDYSLEPPKEIGRIKNLVALVSAHRRIWIAATDHVLVYRESSTAELSRIETLGRPISRMLSVADGVWVESGSGSWYWREATSSFMSMRPIRQLESFAVIGEHLWASSRDGVFRWKVTDNEAPSLVASNIGLVRRFVRWNGCVWLGAENGLFRVCDVQPNQVEHVAKQASSIDDLIVAGWERGVPPSTEPSSAQDILWVASDIGVLQYTSAVPTLPSIIHPKIANARLLSAGDYLWMISADRFARWKLDATADIEFIDYNSVRWSKVCTDMNAAWFIGADKVIRIPEVQSPKFRLDFESLKNNQFRPDDGSPGDRDARYWNCQEINPPNFPRTYISRATFR